MKKFKITLEREDGEKASFEIEAETRHHAYQLAPIFMPRGFGNCMEIKTFVNGKRELGNC